MQNADGQYKPGNNGTVYPAGTKYDVAAENVTLYATWSRQNVDAQFFIRKDGIIPTEPQGHPVSEYTNAIDVPGAIKVATFYTNSTPPGVLDRLNKAPTDAQIKRVLSTYDSNTQYVLWYVIKAENTWHVDGVLLEKSKVNLSYNANAPEGTWANMPDGKQYTAGSTVTVSDLTPTRNGYTFTGWNTKANGTGISYAGNAQFIINKDTTLYAQWEANSRTAYNVEFYYEFEGQYPQEPSYSETRYGRTDATVSVTSDDKMKAGYVFDSTAPNVETGVVLGDGSLTLKLYFKQQFTVTYIKGEFGDFPDNVHSNLNYQDDTPAFSGAVDERNAGQGTGLIHLLAGIRR